MSIEDIGSVVTERAEFVANVQTGVIWQRVTLEVFDGDMASTEETR